MVKPLIIYVGGKRRLAPWIASHFRPHRVYVEGYVGAGGMFLSIPPAKIEIINDLDPNLIALFRTCRDTPDELIETLDRCEPGTDLHSEALAYCEGTGEPIWQGAMRYAAGRLCFNGVIGAGYSLDKKKRNSFRIYRQYVPILAARLRHVHIKNINALELIPEYDRPNHQQYHDPPYIEINTHHRQIYHTGKYFHSIQHHTDLIDRLLAIKYASAIVSGYKPMAPEVVELYGRLEKAGWQRHDQPWQTILGQHHGATPKAKIESIWVRPN